MVFNRFSEKFDFIKKAREKIDLSRFSEKFDFLKKARENLHPGWAVFTIAYIMVMLVVTVKALENRLGVHFYMSHCLLWYSGVNTYYLGNKGWFLFTALAGILKDSFSANDPEKPLDSNIITYLVVFIIVTFALFIGFSEANKKPWEPEEKFHQEKEAFFEGGGWAMFNQYFMPLKNDKPMGEALKNAALFMYLWPSKHDTMHAECYIFGHNILKKYGILIPEIPDTKTGNTRLNEKFVNHIEQPELKKKIAELLNVAIPVKPKPVTGKPLAGTVIPDTKAKENSKIPDSEIEDIVELSRKLEIIEGNKNIYAYFSRNINRFSREQVDILTEGLRDGGTLNEHDKPFLKKRIIKEFLDNQ
ncbi:MAG: hypothetical protein GY795_37125 [Desulfobacterales bacterium]|nr:hypothetical protein [Desulfobacterales bacterium]